jgi:SMI1/KNR4 family protein SUKH-1
MTDRLSSGIIARLKARAGIAERRSDASDMSASSGGADDMLAGMARSDNPAVREYLEGMNTPFAGMISNMVAGDASQAKGLFRALGRMLGGGSMFMSIGGQTVSLGAKRKAEVAPPPASEEQVAAVEDQLGFALPAPLRQFYLEVANGGVGPGDGLYSLKQLLSKWREMTGEPVGPRGQKWPQNLLPIEGGRWDLTCIDRDSGKLFYFDVEEIDYGGWKKCFQEQSDSLEAWLDKWLGKPSAAEKAARRAERPAPTQLTDEDWEVWAAESPENREYMRRLDIATMTPEERAGIGLTEDDWAEKMWDGLDLSKIRTPTPGYADRRRSKGE